MLFNVLYFVSCMPIVFALYGFVTSRLLKLQNLRIVVSSNEFYGRWDWRCFNDAIHVNYLGIRMASPEFAKAFKAHQKPR